ncbi:ParB/RepB/Spo0J family partition protein [Candidatus Saccharibacteria bacterium CPR2]|nr:ParB/RepB/Spo0J family partition protein [Candidatus Saccharibacteria bacterium CPR2]
MARLNKRGLGKGLDSLIPKRLVESEFDPTKSISDDGTSITDIPISKVWPDPDQPRRTFKREDLDELAESIKQHGILQPLIVTPSSKGQYQIIAGERRWRAAKLANLKTLPVIIRTDDEQHRLEIALVENIQREDLNPIEMATAVQKLKEQFNLTHQEVAKRVGKPTSTIANLIRILDLPTQAKRALMNNEITEGHARQILALSNEEQQLEFLKLIVRHGWSVRKAEQYVTAMKQVAGSKKAALKRIQTTTPETKKLARKLDREVLVKRTAKGGKLIIVYKDEDDLNKLVKHFLR